MAPEASGEGPQDLPKQQDRHSRSKSEPLRGGITPGRADPTIHGTDLGGGTCDAPIDLTGDSRPNDKSRKHVHGGEHNSEASNKRPKTCSDRVSTSETTGTISPTSSTSRISEDEVLCSMNNSNRLLRDMAKIRQDLEDKDRELILERATHANERKVLKSETQILRNMHDDSQQRLKDYHEQQLQHVQTQAQLQIQSAVSGKDEALKALEARYEAVRLENKNRVISLQARLDEMDNELNTARKELAASRDSKAVLKTELEGAKQEVQESYEDREISKAVYEAREVLNKKLDVRVKSFDKRLTEAREKFKMSQAAHDSEISQLNIKMEELKAHNRTLQTDLDSQIERYDEATTDLLQQVRDSQGLSQRYNFKASDEEIGEQWGNLQHRICQFVDKYAKPIAEPVPQLDATWIKLSPVISELLTNSLLSAFAFEAYLWKWLNFVAFSFESPLWAGSLGRSLNGLCSDVEASLRGHDDELMTEYHSWRASSSNLLSRIGERSYNHESYHGHVHQMVGKLHALLGPAFIKEDAFCDLVTIVNDARAFEVMRRKLKSCVVIYLGCCDDAGTLQKYNMPLDDAYMRRRSPKVPTSVTDTEMHPGPIVKLVVSPAIVRWGNSNGAGYGSNKCLVKMDVLYSQSPDFVPEPIAQPVPRLSDGQPAEHNTTTPGRHSSEPSNRLAIKVEHAAVSRSPGRSSRLAQSSPASMAPDRNTRPRRAAKENVRQNCYHQLNEKEGDDELNGDPDDFEDPKKSKPSGSKKRRSTGGDDRG